MGMDFVIEKEDDEEEEGDGVHGTPGTAARSQMNVSGSSEENVPPVETELANQDAENGDGLEDEGDDKENNFYKSIFFRFQYRKNEWKNPCF